MGVSLSRDEMMEEAFNEGQEEVLLDELAQKEDVTIEDLRRLPDTQDYDDEQLKTMWEGYKKSLNGEQNETPNEPVAPAQPWKPSLPLFGQDGKPIEDFSKLTVQDLFDKIQFGYKANNKDHQKTLQDIIRVAQLGHHNEERYANVIAERNQVATQLNEVKKQIAEFESQRGVWEQALLAVTQGNTAPLKALVAAYQEKLNAQPQGAPQGYLTPEQHQQEIELISRGQQVLSQVIMPRVNNLASQYGAKAEEIAKVAEHLIQQEGEFLTPEKLQSILEYDIPNTLERYGYRAGQSITTPPANLTPAPTQPSAEVEELRKTVAALQEQVAGKHNKTVVAAKRTFPAPGGGNVPGAGESMPDIKNRSDMKQWLRS